MLTRCPPLLLGMTLLLALGSLILLERATEVDLRRLALAPNRMVLDRNGEILRWLPDAQGRRHLYQSVERFPRHLVDAFIAAEDKRFFEHCGVDFGSILRAFKDNLRAGGIVSGASTLTQQLVRMAYPRGRSYGKKFLEAVRALRLERALGKRKILEFYLNRVPLGNNLRGVEAAARVYFGTTARQLTLAEAATLAALPKAPGRLNPYGPHRERLLARRNRILEQMQALGAIDDQDRALGISAPAGFLPKTLPFEAPHWVDHILAGTPSAPATSLDLRRQKQVERVLGAHRAALEAGGARQAAVVVLQNSTAEILALAGSLDYGDRHGGFNNGALALRSPGSALKPFLYAQALESGFRASDVLEDVRRDYPSLHGAYRPFNFNRVQYGPVSLREALGNSLNQSAVFLLNRIGPEAFYRTLQSLGLINHPERGPGHYGLGLVLGNPEVSLVQLVSAYAALANGGEYRRARFRLLPYRDPGVRIFSRETSYIVTRILSDPAARELTFGDGLTRRLPFPMAVKTGTSSHYRDAWIVGYTPEFTVGVWAGNFEGSPTDRLTGASATGPILAEIMEALHPDHNPGVFPRPEAVAWKPVCSLSGMRPGPHCPHTRNEWFVQGSEPEEMCRYHTASGNHHDLPAPFAHWLHGRFREEAAGRYRLSGFSTRLAAAFGDGSATLPPSRTDSRGVRIVSPVHGDRFVPGPGRERGTVALKARADFPIARVTWFVNGREYAVTGPPYETRWQLERGAHEITAVAPGGRGESIRLFVE